MKGISIGTEVAFLETTAMVRRDWSRTIRQSASCLASVVRKDFGSGTKVLLARKVSFPPVAPSVAACRVSSVVTRSGHTVRVSVDLFLLGGTRRDLPHVLLSHECAGGDGAGGDPNLPGWSRAGSTVSVGPAVGYPVAAGASGRRFLVCGRH